MPKKALIILLILFLVVIVACKSKQEKARENLKKLNIEFTANSFIERAKNGDIVAVRDFLDSGMDPQTKNDAGCSAMFFAEQEKNQRMVILLKEYGAKEIDIGRILGKWACDNPNFSDITIYSKNGKYFYQTDTTTFNADALNDDTLIWKTEFSFRSPIIHEVKLAENDTLEVSNILETPLIFKRISNK